MAAWALTGGAEIGQKQSGLEVLEGGFGFCPVKNLFTFVQ